MHTKSFNVGTRKFELNVARAEDGGLVASVYQMEGGTKNLFIKQAWSIDQDVLTDMSDAQRDDAIVALSGAVVDLLVENFQNLITLPSE